MDSKMKPCPACSAPLELPTQFLDAVRAMRESTESFVPAIIADHEASSPTGAMYKAAVRTLWALAEGEFGALATINEDYQGSVDDLIGKLKDFQECKAAIAALTPLIAELEASIEVQGHNIKHYADMTINLEAERKLFTWLEDETLDLRCLSYPTGGDDYDVVWVVIEHYQADPQEREIGRGTTPIKAIEQALKPKETT